VRVNGSPGACRAFVASPARPPSAGALTSHGEVKQKADPFPPLGLDHTRPRGPRRSLTRARRPGALDRGRGARRANTRSWYAVDADAVVPHEDIGRRARSAATSTTGSPARCGTSRVLDQVLQHLEDVVAVDAATRRTSTRIRPPAGARGGGDASWRARRERPAPGSSRAPPRQLEQLAQQGLHVEWRLECERCVRPPAPEAGRQSFSSRSRSRARHDGSGGRGHGVGEALQLGVAALELPMSCSALFGRSRRSPSR